MYNKVIPDYLRATVSAMPAEYKYQMFMPCKAWCRIFYQVLLALLLTMFFSESGQAGRPASKDAPPPLVTVAAVREQDVNPPAEYVGHVEAIQTVELRARVEGFLEQINFKEGKDVSAGDLLYLIEQAPYLARVNADNARVANAKAVLTKARQYLLQVRTVRSGGVSASDIDTAIADELRAGARLQEAEANLELSELKLAYTTIIAPIDGRIGRTVFTKGNLVGSGSAPLARIVQLNPIRVVYSVSENDISAVQAALKDSSLSKKNHILEPRIKLQGGKILKTRGHVDFVDNVVDAATGTIAVRAVFDNKVNLLLPGQYVTVLVSRSEARQLPVVPQAAVLEDREGRYVLVVDRKNEVVQRRITTGPFVGTDWAVKSGLATGELVIVQGVQKVRPGQTVKTIIKGKPEKR